MTKKLAVTEAEDTSKDDVLDVVFDDETGDLAPLKHFHRALRARDLSNGPLANPRRTRLS